MIEIRGAYDGSDGSNGSAGLVETCFSISNIIDKSKFICKRNPGGQRAARAKDIKKSKNSTRPSALISAEQKRKFTGILF